MLVNRKPTGTASGIPGGLAMGNLAALIVTIAMAALLALLVSRETMTEESLGYGVMVLLFLSAAIGGIVAYGRIKRRRLLVFALSALCYLVTLTALTALFFGGRFDGIFPTAMLIIGGSGTSFFLSARAGRGGKRHKIPKHFR